MAKKKEPRELKTSASAMEDTLPLGDEISSDTLDIFDSEEPVADVAPQPQPAAVPDPVPEQVLDLHDAARRFIPGFQERWFPGILAEAKSMGFSGSGTVSECLAVFRRWGAKV
jgi:hypothetical protein